MGLVVAEVTGGAGGMLNKGVDPNLFFCSIKSPLKSSYSLSQSRPQLLFLWVPPLKRNNELSKGNAVNLYTVKIHIMQLDHIRFAKSSFYF